MSQTTAAILHGQCWRLFTGHLVHLGWLHLALNLLGIALPGVIASTQRINASSAARTLVVMLGTSVGLLLFAPELAWYRGASWRRSRHRRAYGLRDHGSSILARDTGLQR